MKKNYILVTFVFTLLQTSLNAQSLTYPNSYNLNAPTHIGDYGVPRQEIKPTGMIFGDSGTKFYTVGSEGDFVLQYTLSTAYDVSTISGIVNYFDVSGEESNPQDVIFNAAGTKMYILGGAGDDITEYVVSTAWDISSIDTATNIPVVFDVKDKVDTHLATTNQGDDLSGFRFNDDGTRLFVVDYSSDRVYQFNLTLANAFDISMAGFVVASMNISGEENQARAIEFNNDGTQLYIIGHEDDEVNTYNLMTGYSLSTFTTKTVSISLTAEDDPEALLINNTGTKVYVAGLIDQDIKEYSLSPGYDFSSISATPDATTIFATLELNPQGMVFNTDGTKLFVVGSTSDRVLEISLSTPYDISSGTLIASFSIADKQKNPRGLAFNSLGDKLFIIGNDNDWINQYNLTGPFDLSSTITHEDDFSVNIPATGSENSPTDMYFNETGTKLFVLGTGNDKVYQFSLAPAYDLTAATGSVTFDGDYSISGETSPQGIAFSVTGNKMYIAGDSGNDINEFTLTNNFDLTTGTITNSNTFSILNEEDTITDIIFSNDGSRFAICGTGDDEMNQYFTKTVLPETIANDGTIDDVTTPFIITLTGGASFFASSGLFSDTEVTFGGVPEGLTPVLSLNSATQAQLTFTGKANSHLNSDEALVNLSVTFTDAAFASLNAADVSQAIGYTNFLDFDYIECADNQIVYDGSSWAGGNNAGVPDNGVTDLGKAIRVQGDVTITANTNCDCLHIESGQTLVVADGVELTIANALELEGDIRLLGDAQLIQTHSGVKNASGSGNLYKDVLGSLTNVFQSGYWSSPVTTDGVTYTISGVLKDGTTPLSATSLITDINFIAGFDGETSTPIKISTRWLAKLVNSSAFESLNESTGLLNPGEGFNKKSTGNGSGQNYTFVGRPNDGEYQYDISPFGAGIYSLYGNPYASPIDADTFLFDNATTAGSIKGTLYFYQAGIDFSHVTSEYTGGYATRVIGMGAIAPELSGLGGGGKIPGQNIGIGQAFFVEASVSGGTVTFNNDQRVFDTSTLFFSKSATAKKTTDFPVLRIGFEFPLEGNTYHRQVAVGLRGLTNNYENGFEAEMWDYKSTDMALKIDGTDLPYAITGIGNFDTSLKIPLAVQADSDRDVTFKIDENLSLDTNIYLFDSTADTYYDITSQDATISLTEGNYDDRFFITFSDVALSVQENTIAKVTISNTNGALLVSSKDLLEQVSIYNILGQNVATINNSLKEPEIKVNTTNLKSGIYIVKAKNSKGNFTQKVIID
ncbi:beta-propeller fold lactonase family protein [uncultured Polaribacter sp.]|uniref:beta-propeller fold lactonase family protein n=1 Tax=uncultured Polaribacter sp. TaxID=174711 RepID=UPI00262B69DD|nr:beta-propeller fold lactonase family protein [uncultured Polaribacter sp.]